MSEQERKVNAKSLLDYIQKVDGEIAALEARIAEIEAKIAQLRLSGKPVPELPAMVQELEQAKQQAEAMRKRRAELVIISYNQALLEYQEIQDGLKERLKLDAKAYATQVKKLVDEFYQRYELVQKIFDKAAGAEEPLAKYDDKYSSYTMTVDLVSPEKLFDSIVEGFERLLKPRLIKYISEQCGPARVLAKLAAQCARVDRPSLILHEINLPRPTYDGKGSDE